MPKSKNKPNFIENPKPNAGIERKFKKDLLTQTKKMNKSLNWWLLSRLKQGGNIANKLSKEFNYLKSYWELEFNEFSKKISNRFIRAIQKNADDALLKKGLVFNNDRKSAQINAILNAEIKKNIALIKSIPKEQILRYENTLYEAVGNLDRQDLANTIKNIEKKLSVNEKIAERRARTIARDQTKKATEALGQARAQSSGYEYYIWITANDERVSGNPSGKYPNAKGGHYHLDGRIYKYGEPTAIIDSYGTKGTCGERVNCRCTSGAVYLMPNEELRLIKDSEHGDYYEIVNKDEKP